MGGDIIAAISALGYSFFILVSNFCKTFSEEPTNANRIFISSESSRIILKISLPVILSIFSEYFILIRLVIPTPSGNTNDESWHIFLNSEFVADIRRKSRFNVIINMLRKIHSLLLLAVIFVFLFSTLKSQTIEHEIIKQKLYEIAFSYPQPVYSLKKEDGLTILKFSEYMDESKPGEFILPFKDLFIPIPPDSKPEVLLEVTEREEITAYPEINPEVRELKDGSLSYTNIKFPKNYYQLPLYEVRGFLWIEKNYCLHLRIRQVEFDPEKRLTRINKKFTLQLIFQNPIPVIKSDSERIINNTGLLLKNKFLNRFDYKPLYRLKSDDSWIDYSKEYLKIGTAKDAVYRVQFNDLISLGIDPQGINPKTFKMMLRGKEIPVYVSGENDLNFNTGDYIEFAGERNMGGKHREEALFGQPYNEYLDRYGDTTIYWLTWGGSDGLRVDTSGGAGIFSTDTLNYYNEIIHNENDRYFDFSMADLVRRENPFWYENKTWVDAQLGVGTLAVNFQLSDVYPNKPAEFFYKLQDYASNISSNAHLLGLSVNSDPTVYDSGYINRYDQKVLHAEVNSNILTSGNNSLFVHSYPTEASLNSCVIDWSEAEYPRFLTAIDDSLNFKFPFLLNQSSRVIHINNVNVPSVIIWKLGNSYKRYSINSLSNEIFLTDTVGKEDKFILIDPQKISKPRIYYKKYFRNLRSTDNSAEYIAVTHKKFLENAQSYVDFISDRYGLATEVVDIDDIYDEFAYGFFNPEAIKDFLMDTHNFWETPKPNYVCLIGSATYDYYGNKTKYFGAPPVYNYVPSFGSPVSDNWFVTWDTTGAYVPQLNVGRLPFADNKEFDNYFQKHVTYLSNGYDDWNKRYLFFSGGRGDDQSEINLLKSVNQFIVDNYATPPPIGGLVHHFYKTINPNTNFGPFPPEEIKEAIDEGALFISYIGHSGTQTWDNSITDPLQLSNNRNRYSLITDFGCSTAKFAEPDVISFAQTFINSERGQAICYIGNSSIGFVSTATTFPQLFYGKMIADSVYTISQAHKLAKLNLVQAYGATGSYGLFALTNTLIGDPVVTLPVPAKPNLYIDNGGVTISPLIPDEDKDSLKVSMVFFNYGKVTGDSMSIQIKDLFQGSENYNSSIKRVLPLFNDSFSFSVPIYKKPGNHSLVINLDSNNEIDEIYGEDNLIQIDYNVTSSSVKPYLSYREENAIDSLIYFLNPSVKSLSEILEVDLSDNKDFIGSTLREVPLDTFFTKLDLKNLSFDKRYWLRSRLKGTPQFNDVRSFTFNNAQFLLNDSVSFSGGSKKDVSVFNNKVILDTLPVTFEVLSAGLNDGTSAIISKNSQNFIPENTLRGHHICLFKDTTYDFVGYKLFDLLGNPNAADSYISFLDTLDENYLVMIAISDEGSVSSQPLKEKLKEFGSIYIDSVQFRSSWALIGKRSAEPGSVPESFTNPFEGRVIIDTSIAVIADSGYYTTVEIGPSSKWIEASINKLENSDSRIKHLLIGTSADGFQDTLGYFEPQNGMIDLRMIDAGEYPYLTINSEFYSSSAGTSPELNSIGVNYLKPPELGTNYQAVSVSNDSVMIGEDVILGFYVYNIGESRADSFKVQVEIVYPDNSHQVIFETIIDSLNSLKRRYISLNYNTSEGSGQRFFNIKIDSENKIQELFEDNNLYTLPFYIKGDTSIPSLNITFDGVQIIDGDYISDNPEIKIELNDPSLLPVSDTSSISIRLNDMPVYYSGNSGTLSYQFSPANPKMVVTYKPHLTSGEYNLKVLGKNALGSGVDSSGIEKTFLVSQDADILYVYNYPNPFSGETYFTFKLTQIPDELKIKIFTVAGRLVKEIRKSSSELNYDFNRIPWDGRDEDGDLLANGIYFYKVIMTRGNQISDTIQKIAIVR
jgi:hypothetical protein